MIYTRVGSLPRELPAGEIQNGTAYAEGKERLQKEEGHSSLVGGRFIKEGNLPTRHVLGIGKRSRFLYLSNNILKSVYTGWGGGMGRKGIQL